ncbi:CubicO group peptidase, beta-lactamase class C family [Saccharicrinis carchari]|uniref:CubicO group peptidase, beta-lactamase class C family n=1 Tax=Saccharicrinis carchari TaxID=1168039 RepID=A0A521EA48_SACCC|nr:serine hydrolase [Saccharicrinis carchari]SMO80789.1 CubicO group peptidase, beta-lactamase class C family [Saccharicrinis carchari]
MTKYIFLFAIIISWQVSLRSQGFWDESKIDAAYLNLSIEQKVKSILIVPTIRHYSKRNDSAAVWLSMDRLFKLEEGYKPMVSDMLMRSAFMNGKNHELQNQLTNVLLRKKADGVYFPMQSPYSLLFQDNDNKPVDFFLEPAGKLVVPFIDEDTLKQFFKTKLYKLPEKVLSEHDSRSGISPQQMATSNYLKGTDWKNMQKMLKEYENPTLEMLLKHGGLIYSDDVENDYNTLLRLFRNNILPVEILEKSCKKRLRINELLNHKPDTKEYFTLKQEVKNVIRNLYKKGAVLLENEGVIPVNKLVQRNIASIHIGVEEESVFQKTLSEYSAIKHFTVEQIPNMERLNRLRKEMENYNTIIVGVNGDWYEQNVNIKLYSFLHQISSTADLILVHFGSGNRLAALPDAHPFKAVLLSFDSNNMAQDIAAQIIFGGVAAQGILAKRINDKFTFGTGVFTQKTRLGYAPTYEKANTDTLRLIDQLAYKTIRERATPGCCVLVVKDGDVIYNKAFGYHTYNKKNHVATSDLYDVASVTKIVSAVPALMRMYDEGKLKLDDSLSYLLPRLKGTNKGGLRIDDVMLHQAGLKSWIPFYIRAIDRDKLNGEVYGYRYSNQYNLKLDTRLYLNKSVRYRSDIFRSSKADDFNIEVSGGLMMNHAFIDSMRMGIDTSEVKARPKYLYSDLGYYYIKEIVEQAYSMPLDMFTENAFYKPLGAARVLYNPLRRFSKKEIVPTENDRAFRKELIHGYVHDPGAAMMGGVGGHAGVFASAGDLAKVLQMYLNKGSYGGERYIDSTTISLFSAVQKEGNRRGLGFDKPVLDPELSGPACPEASPLSYGHSGFTGTLVWVDPEYDLIYVFLSNRVHPNQYNKKLITDNVRTKIQSVVYRALPEYWEKKSSEPAFPEAF